MRRRWLFTSFATIQKYYCYAPRQHLLQCLCFRLHQGPANFSSFEYLCFSTNFSSFEYLCFWANFSPVEYLCFSFLLIFKFIVIYYTRVKTEKKNYIIIKIEKFSLCFIICFDTQSTVTLIRNYNAMTSEFWTKESVTKCLWEILKEIFVTVESRVKMICI